MVNEMTSTKGQIQRELDGKGNAITNFKRKVSTKEENREATRV